MSAKSIGKHILLQGAGWILVIVGLAAMVLPGPGLLALFAGMAILATQYEWADRRLAPVKKAALGAATDSVKNWFRVLLSMIGVFLLIALGVFWGIGIAAPSWWPVDDRWWLAGGWGTGATLIASGIAALVMLAYSYVNFRDSDDKDAPAARVEADQANDPSLPLTNGLRGASTTPSKSGRSRHGDTSLGPSSATRP